MRFNRLLILIVFGFTSFCVLAQNKQMPSQLEDAYLRQAISQLEALKQTLQAASQYQNPLARTQFHYHARSAGEAGLLDDVITIEHGILQKLSSAQFEASINPITGDYVSNKHNA